MMILLVKGIICVLLGVPNLKNILYVEGLLNNSKLHQCLVFHGTCVLFKPVMENQNGSNAHTDSWNNDSNFPLCRLGS